VRDELVQRIREQRALLINYRGQLGQIEGLQPKEMKQALRTLEIEDDHAIKLIADLEVAETEEARLYHSGFGENHPSIQAARSQREIYTEQLAQQLKSMRENHTTRILIAEQTLEQLEARLESAQEPSSEIVQSSAYLDREGQRVLVEGHHLLTVTFPHYVESITMRAGAALGSWETLLEQPAPVAGAKSFQHDGNQWTVSFRDATPKDSGGFAVSLTHTPTELETRVVAIDRAGKEHLSKSAERNSTGDTIQHTATFAEPALAGVKAFRFQARAYTWVEFPDIALKPLQGSSQKLKR
jgi:hypothetical protein